METYSRLFGIASLFALEVGGRVRRMHVQGVLRCRCMANEEGKRILNDHSKAFMPIPRGSGGYVGCKPLTVKRMKDKWVTRRACAEVHLDDLGADWSEAKITCAVELNLANWLNL